MISEWHHSSQEECPKEEKMEGDCQGRRRLRGHLPKVNEGHASR